MLIEEITDAQRLVRTDAYQMSIGEIVSMYENREIIIIRCSSGFFGGLLDRSRD